MIPTGFFFTHLEWVAEQDDPGAQQVAASGEQRIFAPDAMLTAPDGTTKSLTDFLAQDVDLSGEYEGDPGPRLGQHEFTDARTLQLPDGTSARVRGVKWRGRLSRGEDTTTEIGIGVGGMVAELALLTANGEVIRILTNHRIQRFAFDRDGRVIES
jgi:hypothetical protein